MTRTQCSDGPAKVSGPICCGRFLLCRLSAASGERGQGARGCAGMVASARRSSWHGWEGTAGLSLAAARSQPAFAKVQVSRLSSGFQCLITFLWCIHIRHRTGVSACNERFDSWRATAAEVTELYKI